MVCVGPCQWLCIIIIWIFCFTHFRILPIFRTLIIFSQVFCEDWFVLLLKDPALSCMNLSMSTLYYSFVCEKIERKSESLLLGKIVTQMRKLRARVGHTHTPIEWDEFAENVNLMGFCSERLLATTGTASTNFAIFRQFSPKYLCLKSQSTRKCDFINGLNFRSTLWRTIRSSSTHSHTNYDV